MAEINDLQEKLAAQQTETMEGNEQKRIEGLKSLHEAAVALEQYENNLGTQKILTFIMYTAFALLFLLRTLIIRDDWRLNLFRYGIGSLPFAACAGIFLFTDSVKAYVPVVVLHVTALTVNHIYSIIRKHKVRNVIPRMLSILTLLKLCRSNASDGLLPPGRFIMSADALTVGCKRNVKPEMAELKGKRLIIAAELEEGMRLNTSTVKQLCSTDEIEAEKKYKDFFRCRIIRIYNE